MYCTILYHTILYYTILCKTVNYIVAYYIGLYCALLGVVDVVGTKWIEQVGCSILCSSWAYPGRWSSMQVSVGVLSNAVFRDLVKLEVLL